MARLSDLRMILYRVKGQLTEHPRFIRGTGVPVEDPAYTREGEELERLSLQLSLVLRELKNKSNLLDVRWRNLSGLALDDRYRTAASIKGQQAEILDVLKLAKEVRAQIEDLMIRSGSIGEGELAQGIREFIENLYHQSHTHGESLNMPDGLAYIPAPKDGFGGSFEGVTIAVFVGLRALLYMRKSTAGK
jgi:hypothetical protein